MNKVLWGQDFENLPPVMEGDKFVRYRVPWLDFIHKWKKFPHEGNPFSGYTNIGKANEWKDPNRLLILNESVPVVTSNRDIYYASEWYFARETENHGWSQALKFVLFIDNANGRARMECFDSNLVETSKEFVKELGL